MIITQWIKVRKNDAKRLWQCVTCENDPQKCGCTEKDEDNKGMCLKYKKR